LTEDRIVNFVHGLAREVSVLWWQTLPKSRSRVVIFFGKWVLISGKWCNTEIYLQWKT